MKWGEQIRGCWNAAGALGVPWCRLCLPVQPLKKIDATLKTGDIFYKRFIAQTIHTMYTRINYKIFPVTNFNKYLHYGRCEGKGKRKAVPLQAWSGPEGSRKLRFTDFMTTAQDGSKVVSLIHRPPLPWGELIYLAPIGSENISTPYFKQCFFRGGITPQTESNTTPPSPKTEITYILFYILNFASIIKFKM